MDENRIPTRRRNQPLATRRIVDWTDWTDGSEETSYTLQVFLRRSYFCYTQAEVAVDDNHLTASNNLVSNYKIDGIGDVTVQFHHVARSEFKNLSKRHLPAAETKRCL